MFMIYPLLTALLLTASAAYYTFARIPSDSLWVLPAMLLAADRVGVFCNGQPVSLQPTSEEQKMLTGTEFQLQVPLIEGINYIVIKLPDYLPEKAFAFRLHPSVTVCNHKYYLNPNTSANDAE